MSGLAETPAEADAASILLNVAVVPPAAIAAEIAHASSTLIEYGSELVVDPSDKQPHLTIFMARFPASSVSVVRQRLDQVLSQVAPFEVEHSGVFLTPGLYYEASYQRTHSLEHLQRLVADGVADLRFQPGFPVRELYFGPYSTEQQSSAETSGYDLFGELYRPHITIGKFRTHPEQPLPKPKRTLSFHADRIALFRADDLGAGCEMLAEYRLQ